MKNFTLLLTDLRAAIAAVAARERGLTALLVVVFGRLCRVATRVERLYGLWLAGKVPVAATPRAPRVRRAGAVRLPASPMWLAARVWEVRVFGSYLQNLLAEPEFAAFVAAVPQAQRILRPLCRMLRVVPLPAVLRPTVVRGAIATMNPIFPDGIVSVVALQKFGT